MSVELFCATTDYVRGATARLTSDALGLPTPCEGWDVGMVVVHLGDVATALVGLVATGELRMPDAPGTYATDVVARFQDSLTELEASLSKAHDGERAVAARQAGIIEFAMHGWDVGVAADHDHRVPADTAVGVLGLATSLIDDSARGANFAERIDLPPAAPPSDRLAAFLGRRPEAPAAGRS